MITVRPSIWYIDSTPIHKKQYLEYFANDVNTLKKYNSKIKNKKNKKDIRVCTYNVHCWSDYLEKPNIQEQTIIINTINADILILEEVTEQPILPIYKYMAKCNVTNDMCNMIFSRYPIKYIETKILEKFKEDRCAIKATLMVNGKQLDVIGTHLDVYDHTEKTRLKQVKQIIELIGTNPTIIAGDFNSLKAFDYSKEEFDWLEKNSVVKGECHTTALNQFRLDTNLNEVFGSAGLKYTVWTGRRVDYIWITPDIKILDKYVYYTNESDHFPVIADLKINI